MGGQEGILECPENDDRVEEPPIKVSKTETNTFGKLQENHLNLILQHLTVSDYLQLMLVGPGLNKLIGSSKHFTKNTCFAIKDIKGLPKKQGRQWLRETMEKSERVYEHFSIRAEEPNEAELPMLFKNDWKSASISIIKVKSYYKLVKYLSLVAPKLTKLQLSIRSVDRHDSRVRLEFPYLQSLSFTDCASAALEPFLRHNNITTVHQLTLGKIRQSTYKRATNLTSLLSRFAEVFSSLTYLDIGSSETSDSFFENDVHELAEFHLREIRVNSPSTGKGRDNVEKLIIAQGESLAEICLVSWGRTKTIYSIWNATPKLKIFQMTSTKSGEDLNFDVVGSELIKKDLKLLSFDFSGHSVPLSYIQPLMQASRHSLQKICLKAEDPSIGLANLLETCGSTILLNGEDFDTRSIASSDSDVIEIENPSDESIQCGDDLPIEIDSD